MAKSLLRSGSLADFFALGENGQPVYASALQLRETLRLRRQQTIADCLAIPQPNETGDRLDWYAPGEGKVTSWMAAGETEREAALEQLQTCLTTVAALSERALASDNAAQQRFGALLAKAFQFPAANYVYLVGGRPVITFWGFINIDQKPRTDALECLREALPVLTSQPLVDPIAPPIAQPNAAAVYAETASLPVEPDSEPDDAPRVAIPPVPSAAQGKSALRRWWWVAPGVALAGALVWQFRAGAPSQPITAEPVVAHTPEKRVLPATEKTKEAEIIAQNATPIAPPPVAAETPPEAVKAPVVAHPETAPVVAQKPAPTPSTPPVETVVAEVKPEEAKPVDKNALVMPILSVKLGKTDFLNGTWRVTADTKTPTIGKPASLRYQLKDGQGTVRLTHGEGVSCRANVTAGLMQSGNLIINSRVKARCSDGSRYQMPEIVCCQGASGPAECSGRYDDDNLIPLTFKRESE
ncbi:SrfA family protein [Symbiopectobacterium purcellii]|uniref:SrfA family protein n=1 Tax=Symbiopectobacterium purcellii TaxID=2871826 RepID=A0ABX9AQY8_9ENTR|nr:SrfA family protein [Symbiopectobacterium purcellii]QZN97607.1 SrfA family protein [Symbiopectobacterium purcellii]